jgi:hypothetical protein
LLELLLTITKYSIESGHLRDQGLTRRIILKQIL